MKLTKEHLSAISLSGKKEWDILRCRNEISEPFQFFDTLRGYRTLSVPKVKKKTTLDLLLDSIDVEMAQKLLLQLEKKQSN